MAVCMMQSGASRARAYGFLTHAKQGRKLMKIMKTPYSCTAFKHKHDTFVFIPFHYVFLYQSQSTFVWEGINYYPDKMNDRELMSNTTQ